MLKSHVIWNKNHPDNKVKKGEVIHHKDDNHDNDEPSNQQKMIHGKHNRLHMMGNKKALGHRYKATKETKKKMSLAARGRKHTKETKRKISEANKGNKHRLGMKHTEKTKRKMRVAQTIAWRKRKNAISY